VADLSPRPLRATERDRRLFVDRPELGTVLKTLLGGGNVLLLGDRGSGKSSAVHRVAADLEARGRNVAVVDGRAATTATDLLARMADVVRSTWSRAAADEPVASGELEAGQLQVPGVAETTSTSRLLIDELRILRSLIAQRGPGVIFVDDPPSDIARTVFGRLRDDLWQLPVAWCVAADSAARAPFITPPADAFWTRIVELGPLDPAVGEELLRRRVTADEVDASLLSEVVRRGEGNPRRILKLAFDVAEGEHSTESLEREQADRDRQRSSLSDPARRLLFELEANGPSSSSDIGLQQRLGWSRGRVSQVFKELRQAGLVRSTTQRSESGRPRTIFEVV
jgi:hypothetical protein